MTEEKQETKIESVIRQKGSSLIVVKESDGVIRYLTMNRAEWRRMQRIGKINSSTQRKRKPRVSKSRK
jgi:hypothetical protein